MAGHTPGPWTWETESGEWPDHSLTGADGDSVLMWDFDLGFRFGCEADASLLAAAPDLLKALKMAQLWLDVDGRFDMQGINAAIAKAEGF